MKMTGEQLRRVAENLVRAMEREGLLSIAAITARVGDAIDPQAEDRYAGEEFVEISSQPSERGTKALVVSYRRRVGETPIEVRINAELGYAKILLTCETVLAGYESFDESDDGDKMQDRKLAADVAVVMAELLALAGGSSAPAQSARGRIVSTTTEHALLCSVCGEKAAWFQIGMSPGDDHFIWFDLRGERRWMFSGSTSEDLGEFLANDDLKGLQARASDESFDPVLDAYCPECDAVFCAKHATLEPRPYAVTCPKGHRRAIDR